MPSLVGVQSDCQTPAAHAAVAIQAARLLTLVYEWLLVAEAAATADAVVPCTVQTDYGILLLVNFERPTAAAAGKYYAAGPACGSRLTNRNIKLLRILQLSP